MRRFIAYMRAPAIVVSTVLSLGACAPLLDGIALDLFEDSELQPTASNYEKGKAEFMGGHMGLAVLHFQAALVEQPESIEALNGLGASFDQLGRYDLSARAYTRALELSPDDIQTLNNMGYSYLLQGRHDIAVAYLRAAAALSDGDAKIQANRILAEDALARAGGPRGDGLDAAPQTDSEGASSGPYLVRGGKAVKHLVTQGRADAGESIQGSGADLQSSVAPAKRPYRDGLPDFAAAPMAIGGTSVGSPNLKAMRSGF